MVKEIYRETDTGIDGQRNKRKRSSKTNNKFKRLSDKAIVDAYIKTSILITFGCRICPHHLDVYGFLKKQCLGKPLQAIYFYLRRL